MGVESKQLHLFEEGYQMQESSKLCCREILLRHEHPRLRVNTSSRAGFDLDTRLLAPEESREKKKKSPVKIIPFGKCQKL